MISSSGGSGPAERAPSERVLVIRLSSLGDLVLSLPALERIRHTHSGARIELLTKESKHYERLRNGESSTDCREG